MVGQECLKKRYLMWITAVSICWLVIILKYVSTLLNIFCNVLGIISIIVIILKRVSHPMNKTLLKAISWSSNILYIEYPWMNIFI